MNTHIQQVWNRAKQPIAVGLGAILVGAVLGIVFPPEEPHRFCPSPLKAHFLERHIAFEFENKRASSSSSSSPSSERMRAAAPVHVEASSSSEAPVLVPIVEGVVAPASSSEASVQPSSSSVSSEAPSSSSSASSDPSSGSSSSVAPGEFPAFERTVFPVARVPNWGAMKTPAEWNRTYAEMDRDDFVRVPAYDMDVLTTPMKELLENRNDPRTVEILTAKLFYSTRHFGSYDLDQGEFTGDHAGIDLKLAEGTPVGSIAGGRVSTVRREKSGLGLHVVVEHRVDDETYYAIYGHLDSVAVREGQDVAPGDLVGRSGSTGRSASPHLHLQIDKGTPAETLHGAYQTDGVPSRTEAARNTVNPVSFIEAHR